MAAIGADDACCDGDSKQDANPSVSSSKTNTEDLADWMGNLPPHLLDVPLHRLAIPGE